MDKSKQKSDIFQMASKIAHKLEEQQQVNNILNAYRRVQDIKVSGKGKKKQFKAEPRNTTSKYSEKVKQTLKQMNSNKHKQFPNSKQLNRQTKQNRKGPAQTHLKNKGCQRFFIILVANNQANQREFIYRLSKVANQLDQEKYQRIRKWKLKRIFSAWEEQIMLIKIQKARLAKEKAQKQKKIIKMAHQFHYFTMMKKSLVAWKNYTKKSKKAKLLRQQQQMIRQQMRMRQQQQKIDQLKRQAGIGTQKQQLPKKQQSELSNKLKGFLSNLKEQVQNKGRLNTIKQKTQQSDIGINRREINDIQEFQNQDEENQQVSNQRAEAQPEQSHIRKGPMTNEDLQKRRNQLAAKARNRKKMLDQLKKEKQQKKKKQEQQQLELERQIQLQAKKARQQQYRKFMKQKKQQEQWQVKQKQLMQQAQEHNRLRIMAYYGIIPWMKLKSVQSQKAQKIANLLTKIIMKRKLEIFIENVQKIGNQKLQKAMQRAQKIYQRKTKIKVMKGFKICYSEQLQLKQQMTARHEYTTQKIFFKLWLDTRPQIQLQNFEWERPLLKKAQIFKNLTLMQKTIETLKKNKQQQQQKKRIQQHKKKIEQKIKVIVQQKPTINYDDFL